VQLIKRDPQCSEAYYVRGQAFYLSENYEQALKHYQECARVSLLPGAQFFPRSPRCLRRDPDHAGASADLKRVRALERLTKAAREHVTVREFDKALPLFTDAIALDPSNALLNSKLLAERGEAQLRSVSPNICE